MLYNILQNLTLRLRKLPVETDSVDQTPNLHECYITFFKIRHSVYEKLLQSLFNKLTLVFTHVWHPL